ncbi:hypothetical protein [Paenibacillus marinisediminis]
MRWRQDAAGLSNGAPPRMAAVSPAVLQREEPLAIRIRDDGCIVSAGLAWRPSPGSPQSAAAAAGGASAARTVGAIL